MSKSWRVPIDTVHRVVPELRVMSSDWLDELHQRGIYTAPELAALRTPTTQGRQCSWAANPNELAGRLTQVALSGDAVVAGVELWQNQRDRYWFLEGLIRNQSRRFKGAGREVVSMAVAYVSDVIKDSGRRYGLRVHAMSRELDAVAWWTRYVGRTPDFDTAYMRINDLVFSAVGWVLVPTPN
jgi:hypothetical protein